MLLDKPRLSDCIAMSYVCEWIANEFNAVDAWKDKLRENVTNMVYVPRIREWTHAPEVLYDYGLMNADILDIGSDLQFISACMMLNMKNVIAHNVTDDFNQLLDILTYDLKAMGYPRTDFRNTLKKYKQRMIVGFLEDLPIADGSFDAITNISVLEHIPPQSLDKHIDACWRALKPGGLFIATCDWFVHHPVGWSLDWDFNNHDYNAIRHRLNPQCVFGTSLDVVESNTLTWEFRDEVLAVKAFIWRKPL